MTTFLKPSQIKLDTKSANADDPRFRSLVRRWNGKEKCDIGIVGVPFDEGVRLSGGRIGAAKAPDAIREQLARYGTAYNISENADLSRLSIADCGNVTPTKNSRAMHERIENTVGEVLAKAKAAIVLGGGNDISYASVRALTRATKGRVGGANIDAHFDVRPVVGGKLTSGTPYRRLLAEGVIDGKHFAEIGVQGQVNAKAHREYLLKKHASIVLLSDVRKLGADRVMSALASRTKSCAALFVSIDIDVVAQAFAPGSSAPSSDGLFPEDILRFAYLAGRNPKVRLFEIVEVNPLFDVDERTSRLAANIILEFCAGFAGRL
ncbi:MAG: formimidoylglutamase [Candidatus Lloydbacteria bacterium RIFCSPHIGHO2_02_FULL_54_17]|uniref:Formimidoylglutamase n=1 Tax=Candidatus Lloydbacteria bacterium RIFCSPHIGHO2_02_FULL_54_17 TaxID=1798664 RepID=A0A1G2DFZ0_9BACT|nr:MAG: formimidoylglutamase [Candidatus Lloydbacteria bacterium RIFCSPHIGHO2_01_FULL_54_11]OGZ11780.1 MAG: formimidoylglutamase [Candidatus Lloydbacteria bacterium RIFCSPHIGHO2_02_FULL_54_17]OGZ14309.1 MAG: formimidoylglutamase [Candidatus Lloydbacteria bacterium RIFCSPLOWO2_01_FULL_54_18]OGZ16023.1 MAG: formimidoylglutamase [Candidatus Lloydbacteria bacterium RIFCSPLOWO2_02_FULL_54_12]